MFADQRRVNHSIYDALAEDDGPTRVCIECTAKISITKPSLLHTLLDQSTTVAVQYHAHNIPYLEAFSQRIAEVFRDLVDAHASHSADGESANKRAVIVAILHIHVMVGFSVQPSLHLPNRLDR